ncbi:hypothetical protein LZ686_17310 [Paracoccus sp. NFXS7]|uniref:hypothetical protein n=1 Tax=Paracoccus sp. NFXS7 TaxID=2908653 RepID=UPI0032DF5F24
MARLLLTDFHTNEPLAVPYTPQTDLTLTDQPHGATRVVVVQNGTPRKTFLVQETPAQIRRREDICLF